MRLVIAIIALSLSLSLILCQINIESKNIVFNSLYGLELLLKTERELLSNLENHANALEARDNSKIIVFRRAIAAMREENLKSVDDAETYLSNPLNSFALIRRMHTDWSQWELYMQSPVGEAEIDIHKKLRINLSMSNYMDQAADAMHRLQTTYNLQPMEMAAGLLNGIQYNASLCSRDCFEIGQYLLSQGDIFYSSQWLYAAINLYQEDEINAVLRFDKVQIYDLYMQTFLKQYRYDKALDIVNIILDYRPANGSYLHVKSLIEHEIKTSKQKPKEFLVNAPDLYQRTCRGEFDKNMKRLHCRYNTTTHPFLKLAPLKMEELLMEPYIVLFYDVMSDAEIAEIKAMTRPYLKPAKVFIGDKGERVVDKIRTNHHTFFRNNGSNTKELIMQRITDLSGFDLENSEEMSVMNYILAAHYGPHYDFFDVPEHNKLVRDVGNRIATVVFYLSDVDQGGSTVFPYLNLAVYPRKGSALMWYNLNNRGKIDGLTYHASCPVIVGSKWGKFNFS